jgi:alpha-galactosidase
MDSPHFRVYVVSDALIYEAEGRLPLRLTWPVFSVNGQPTANTGLIWRAAGVERLANGVTERRHSATIAADLTLTVGARIADDSPILRFRYELSGAGALTKPNGQDALSYGRVGLAGCRVTEVRLSEWVDFHHSYEINEVGVADRDFANGREVMGPILVGERAGDSLLLAYEHGSTYPDAFLRFRLLPDHCAELRAVKGNYCAGQPADGYRSVWFLLGAVAGPKEDLAAALRHFLLTRQALNPASRSPYIFYNSWNYQERRKNWDGLPYLVEMNQERMLREIDAAHGMGIEVFVIDTGWFKRTGDWRVNLDRFPDGLQAVRQRLDGYGMKLGLWFDNSAAVESDVLKAHLDCRCASHGQVWDPHVIWETEPAYRMCLVSRYWEAFADELIRLHREVGVRYFKWDAIGQYGCTDPRHFHGTDANSEQERGDSYAFQLPLYMARIAERVADACPDAIIDFDVTEAGRAVGLAFLSAGKFFLVNNGPYCWNYDIPQPYWPQTNANLFFYPGPARTWICRQPLTYDKWVPMNLFLTHYLPDDGPSNQVNAVASLILGQNGIWGDLPAVSAEGVRLIGGLLGLYKQVRADIAAAPPIRTGIIGGCPEIHEKIDPATGRGAVVLFAAMPGEYTYITERAVDERVWATSGMEVTRLPDGRAEIKTMFTKHREWNETADNAEYARIAFFGVDRTGSQD